MRDRERASCESELVRERVRTVRDVTLPVPHEWPSWG